MGRRAQAATDDELIRAMRRDADAFGLFYDRYSRRLYSWLWHETGSTHVALDLTAETFAQALCAARRFRGRSAASAAAWLFGIGRNLLLRYRENQRLESSARRRLGMSLELPADALAEVDERLSSRQEGKALAEAMAELPQEQRQAVELRVLGELAYEEIADELGCSAGAARTRVSRGLRALQRRFEGGIG